MFGILELFYYFLQIKKRKEKKRIARFARNYIENPCH